ncbi:hypothetical protein T4C_12436 [Trichinella pseudospiralis]|uniref:Uncharacterized protein n=1 Tax=Trichinella pseudospiralis TaxID=6337 RepID=A0A0V1GSA4_TRIPS|nr:hypothetical protein T4C_12436 [Trichinella pseudospiralis]
MTPSVQSFHNSMNRIPQLIITLRGTSGDTYMVEGLQPERQTVPEFDFEVAVWPKKKYQNVGRFPDLLARSVPPVMTPETSTWNQKRRTVA